MPLLTPMNQRFYTTASMPGDLEVALAIALYRLPTIERLSDSTASSGARFLTLTSTLPPDR